MSPLDDLIELAKTAEDVGFDSIALPDSLFYMEKQSADYPYTPDGSRMWNADTPWVDPLIAAGAMGAVTSTLRFYTNVMKLGSRNPLLLARQVGSVANLTNNRFGLGVGIGWAPEEFEWCGVPYSRRGARVDEMIDVIKLVLGGGMVEFHGEFYDFDKLQMSPAPSQPVPFYVGGHTDVALRRAARVGDGWTSAMMTGEQLTETIGKLNALRAEYGRTDEPFEFQAVCIDKFGVDGHRELAEAGVTDNIVIPWVFEGLGFHPPLEKKKDSLKRFADTYIHLRMAGHMTQTEHPAHAAGRRSREAVIARDKEAWLAVFAEDAIVEDPIGPSAFDPEGKGHRGRDAISAFWDNVIAPTDSLEFNYRETYQCGDEEANVGYIVTIMGGHQITTEGVFTYKVNDAGKLVALRAYWEMDRAVATARPV